MDNNNASSAFEVDSNYFIWTFVLRIWERYNISLLHFNIPMHLVCILYVTYFMLSIIYIFPAKPWTI